MPKLLIAHGGGPTAVINASLAGAISAARKSGKVTGILAADHGSGGILQRRFLNLDSLTEEDLEELKQSPASAIGTGRTPLEAPDYEEMARILQEEGIGYVLFTGGNGSMDTCGKLGRACAGTGILVGGIPKTVDNDIDQIDHAPGYPSAARFAAQTMREIGMDIASMPIHVCIMEYMGRNSGWITAATCLAREQEGDAPDLILLPEVPFREEAFLEKVSQVWKQGHGVTVAVSEGLVGKDGKPVTPPVFTSGRATYFGDVSSYLTRLVIEKLGVKARCEKPGILGRCCREMVSGLDREEAFRLGELAAETLLDGKGGWMPGLKRVSDDPYQTEEVLIPVEQVMLHERLFPKSFISPDGFDVTPEFVRWVKPLIGETLPRRFRL